MAKAAHLMMVGARDEASIRGDDFYASPPEAVEALCGVEHFTGPIWEPACGDGAISKVLESHGYAVVSSDLVARDYGRSRIDFLMEREGWASRDPIVARGLPRHPADTGGGVGAMLRYIAPLFRAARLWR